MTRRRGDRSRPPPLVLALQPAHANLACAKTRKIGLDGTSLVWLLFIPEPQAPPAIGLAAAIAPSVANRRIRTVYIHSVTATFTNPINDLRFFVFVHFGPHRIPQSQAEDYGRKDLC